VGATEPLDRSPGGSKDRVGIRSSHSLHASFTNPRERRSLGDGRSVSMRHVRCKRFAWLLRCRETRSDPAAPTRKRQASRLSSSAQSTRSARRGCRAASQSGGTRGHDTTRPRATRTCPAPTPTTWRLRLTLSCRSKVVSKPSSATRRGNRSPVPLGVLRGTKTLSADAGHSDSSMIGGTGCRNCWNSILRPSGSRA
jgi:hypothetical protein